MDRRRALTNIAIAAGSIITLPSWMRAAGIADLDHHTSSFSSSQQQILASVADTIIPSGSSIGALTVGVDRFLQKLFDDCYEPEVQDNIKRQLTTLNERSQKQHGVDFGKCSQQQRLAMLSQMRASSDTSEKDFVELLRRETVRGFVTSQKVMQDYLGYEVAPGRYHGCVPVKQ